MQNKKWKILNKDTTKSIIDIILKNRHLPADHMDPFHLSDRMYNPMLLPDMDRGVKRILEAINNEENIFIFGDYDVDGITSTALMIYFFRQINYPVQYMLPHREKDGYGLRTAAVDEMALKNAQLIITVDNGISANEAIEHACELGIDVVVTDHHLQEGELPGALAVINPNRTDSEYPFKSICGAVVAFKLIHAISMQLLPKADYQQFLLNHLDLVAMGTIADVMPLRDENYALVKFGLKVLAGTRKPGLVELKKISGVKGKTITPISVGFFLAPRLNVAGRLDHAEVALRLLISTSMEEAQELAQYLDGLNRKRQSMQNDYYTYALNIVQTEAEKANKIMIVENSEWQAGLIGLVSGKLKERFGRPAIAFTRNSDGNYVGSARSIEAFHMTNALTQFNQYFLTYGGHHKAAGLTVYADRFKTFCAEFTTYANAHIKESDLVEELEIDSIVEIDQISKNTTLMINEIGPFGETNPEPVFALMQARIRDIFPMSGGKHLRLGVEKGNQKFECVWWGSGEYKDSIRFNQVIDLAFKLNINNWQGREKLQLVVEDIRPSEGSKN